MHAPSYYLEKAACMFTEAHYTCLIIVFVVCVHVPVASGIHNAAIDAAAGTSKHAHSPKPAGMSGYAVSNRQIVCSLLFEADLHLSEAQIVWARSIGHGCWIQDSNVK